MILTWGADPDLQLPVYDVCIVGSGPAGATVARELTVRGLRVGVLESGGRKPTPGGDRLRRVLSDGIAIKAHSRERVVGGASTTWAGLSAPLDPVDFDPHPNGAIGGWPISSAELAVWYERASERYRFPGLGAFETAAGGPGGRIARAGELQPQWRRLQEKQFLAADPPQNFGRDWVETFEGPTTDLWLHATVMGFEGFGDPRRATAVRVRSPSGFVGSLRAQTFVLAAGGIENARLLLMSRDPDLWPNGLGNGRDQVGRYFMNHPKGNQGIVHFRRPVERLPYFFGALHEGFAGYAGIRLRDEEQRRLGVLNSYVRLEPLFPWADNPGVESLVSMVKRSRNLMAGWKRTRANEVVELRAWSETGDDSDLQSMRWGPWDWLRACGRIAIHLPNVLRYLYFRLTPVRPKVRSARVRSFMEMEPHPANRVVLSDQSDEYGLALPVIRHQPTELDRRSLVALHEVFARELEELGIGEMHEHLRMAEPWIIDQDASHHLGSTRMGTGPDQSVVDPDLRLHEADNVYVVGGSVFPRGGCANPTYTIVALAIRLAEHLANGASPTPTMGVAQ